MQRPVLPRLARRAAAALACAAVLAGCGSSSGGEGEGASVEGVVAPSIADVTVADDPRAWTGVVAPAIDDPGVQPVQEGAESELPARLTDAQGTEVVVEDTSRILALDIHGTLSRTVFELGLGDQVIGRDVSTQFDEAADLPLVTGNGHELNAEAILALDPTVILTDTSLGPWDVILQLREAGIPVVVIDSDRNLGNVAEITQMVADALGVPSAGTELAQRQQQEIDEVVEAVAAQTPPEGERLRTVFLYVRGSAGVYYMFGQGSGADDLIDAVGGYDVAEEIGWDGMRPVTAEGLVAASPELVVMMSKGLESTGGIDGLLEQLPALAQTPAGRNERIVAMDDSLILGYGPTTAAVVNALAVAVLAPEEVS
jgi:iron complex transport system substrate-binding protein